MRKQASKQARWRGLTTRYNLPGLQIICTPDVCMVQGDNTAEGGKEVQHCPEPNRREINKTKTRLNLLFISSHPASPVKIGSFQ